MKKLYILITILFLTTSYLSAQIDAVTGLSNPSRIFLDGTTMYIADASTVYTADISLLPATPSTLITGLDTPYGLYVNGDDLYVIDVNAIYKKTISNGIEAVGALTTVTSVEDGSDLAIKGSYLYFSEYSVAAVPGVYRVDITGGFPTTSELVVNGLTGPTGIVFDGDVLYISDYDGNAIYSADILSFSGTPIAATLVTAVPEPDGLYLDGTTLYMGLSNNLSSTTVPGAATVDAVVATATTISDVELSGTDLYYVEINNNKIVYFDLSTASVKDYNPLGFVMYPNPSSNFIKISGLIDTESYEISNMLGAKVQSGKVSQNEEINVRSLNKGVYFVKLENGAPLKFIKN